VENQIGAFKNVLDAEWVSGVPNVKTNTVVGYLVSELILLSFITTKDPNLGCPF
jgi:hypothetical protein